MNDLDAAFESLKASGLVVGGPSGGGDAVEEKKPSTPSEKRAPSTPSEKSPSPNPVKEEEKSPEPGETPAIGSMAGDVNGSQQDFGNFGGGGMTEEELKEFTDRLDKM